jgi:hypothetical protein
MTLAGAELPPRSIKKRTVGASRQAAKTIHDGVSTGTDGSERLVQCGGWDHYADAVFSEPGRCWRMVYDGEGSGRPTFCEELVVWVGNHHLVGGKQIRVWSCDGHREGLEEPESVGYR